MVLSPEKKLPIFGVRTKFSLVAFISAFFLFGVQPATHAQTVVDQIVTLVNGQIITRSDLLWSIALDPEAPSPAGPVSSEILRQKLDTMIDQRLVEQEAARMPAADVTEAEVNKARAELVARFPSEAEFRSRVEGVGLTSEEVDRLIRQRVLISKYIDFRFRSFVFISEEDIKNYYEQKLSPDIRKQGQVPPSINEVHDRMQDVLKQQRISEEIDKFLKDARAQAEIVTLAEL
jgi:SurA-like protein